MKPTLESIRERFPNPRRFSEATNVWSPPMDEYCVGGALCRFMGDWDGLPGPSAIALRLEEANPSLTHGDSWTFMDAIMKANDSGDFEIAWAKLGEALEWSGK